MPEKTKKVHLEALCIAPASRPGVAAGYSGYYPAQTNAQIGTKGVKVAEKEYRLSVGRVQIRMAFPSPRYVAQMAEYFGGESTDGIYDIRIKIHVVSHKGSVLIPDSLFTDKHVASEAITIGEGLVHGNIDIAGNEGEIWVQSSLLQEPFIRVFEQLLYQACYSAQKAGGYDAFLIHSAGVIHKGSGFLFVGPAGAGKTTLADLSAADHVLNDEICLIEFDGESVLLHSTPFNGFYKHKKSGSARLQAVFCLSHGQSHRLLDMSKVEAAALIIPQIVPPVALHEELTRGNLGSMLDLAARLVDRIAAQRLEFRPDAGFWELIDGKYR